MQNASSAGKKKGYVEVEVARRILGSTELTPQCLSFYRFMNRYWYLGVVQTFGVGKRRSCV